MKRAARGRLARHLADLLLGILATVVLLLAAEVLLWALGFEAAHIDFARGFDQRAAYLVPEPLEAGAFVTQFAASEEGEVHVGPRDGRLRVLLLGGSNTVGFPGAHLEQALERSASGPGFEVVNLGRAGYGSARVSIVCEQALEHLQPDAIVIYSGHNEFVEYSFRLELQEEWAHPAWRWIGALGARSRVLGLLRDAPGRVVRERPEAWQSEYSKFADLTYTETLAHFEQYRANLERMCRMARERGVEVLLCTVVYNHFAAPHQSAVDPGLPFDTLARVADLERRAEALEPSWMRPLLPRSAQERVILKDWRAAPDARRHGELPAAGIGRRRCDAVLERVGPELPPAHRWSEKVWSLLEALERFHAGVGSDEERAGLERLRNVLQDLLRLAPDHPRAHFSAGLVDLHLGAEPAVAARHLVDAARYDRAPRKGSALTNGIVRDVAFAVAGVTLVDAEQLFAGRMPAGLVGWEWMTDHCHLNPGAAQVLMDDLARILPTRLAQRGAARR